MIYILIFFLLSALAVVLFQVFGGYFFFRARAAKLKGRPDEPFDSIYDAYFKALDIPIGVVKHVWDEAAFALRIPPLKLRPTDSFDAELRRYYGLFSFEDLNDDLMQDMGRYIEQYDIEPSRFEELKTIGEYVVLVALAKIGFYKDKKV